MVLLYIVISHLCLVSLPAHISNQSQWCRLSFIQLAHWLNTGQSASQPSAVPYRAVNKLTAMSFSFFTAAAADGCGPFFPQSPDVVHTDMHFLCTQAELGFAEVTGSDWLADASLTHFGANPPVVVVMVMAVAPSPPPPSSSSSACPAAIATATAAAALACCLPLSQQLFSVMASTPSSSSCCKQ